MNDKDKEAFEKWWMEGFKGMSDMEVIKYVNVGKQTSLHGWQSACEYKQKEIEKLQAENAKLRECLKFTTSAAEYLFKPDEKLAEGLFPTSYFTLSYEGDLEIIEKTKRARQVLKELNNKGEPK